MTYLDAMQTAMTQRQRQRGFTLIEAIMVITITGIIAGVVALFMRTPIQSYFDVERRAEMTDTADTALRRIGRDVRLALPNSVRVRDDDEGRAIEFLQTRTGGRYRAAADPSKATGSPPGNDPLQFESVDENSFDLLGQAITFKSGDWIVFSNFGIPGNDAYEDAPSNRRDYNGPIGTDQTNVQISPDNPLPLSSASPGHRFQVVDTPVTYRCDDKILTRYWDYSISSTQLKNPPTDGLNKDGPLSAVLAQGDKIKCIFTYTVGVSQRNSLVSMQISITKKGETVSLYHEVHVSNAP